MKKKDATTVAETFQGIISDHKTFKLQLVKGKEFINAFFQSKLRERGTQFYVSQNKDIWASVAERFNRTLKTKIWKFFTHCNTYRYVGMLQYMVHSYISTFHRTIGQASSSVKKEDISSLREKMFDVDNDINAHVKLKVGNKVRISKARRTFDKGYLQNWTEEIFSVNEAIATAPPIYKFVDCGEEVKGSFYDKELQRVDKKDEVYKVEKILRTRRRKEVLKNI